eukprot:1177654-Prorocentrum_minimum.AAC.2
MKRRCGARRGARARRPSAAPPDGRMRERAGAVPRRRVPAEPLGDANGAVTPLGLLRCWGCYATGAVTLLGLLRCWGCYAAGAVTLMGLLRCWDCAVPGRRVPVDPLGDFAGAGLGGVGPFEAAGAEEAGPLGHGGGRREGDADGQQAAGGAAGRAHAGQPPPPRRDRAPRQPPAGIDWKIASTYEPKQCSLIHLQYFTCNSSSARTSSHSRDLLLPPESSAMEPENV